MDPVEPPQEEASILVAYNSIWVDGWVTEALVVAIHPLVSDTVTE